ncbi:MAG TPA: CPBP family intramembrane glutamic endopeptidase [Gaiellaceae bacterium]
MSRTRLVCWIALVAAISALEYSARFSGSAPKNTRNDVYSYAAFGSGLIFYGLIFVVVLAIAFDRTDLFALQRPARRAAAIALAVLIGIYLWELVVAALPIRDPGKEQGLTPTHWEPSHAGAFAANVVLFCAIAPVVEELTFRGVGQSLLRFTGRWPSILLVGIAFGLWHGLVQALLVLIPFGVGLAYLRDRTRSVIPGMVVHALFNGAALALAVLT